MSDDPFGLLAFVFILVIFLLAVATTITVPGEKVNGYVVRAVCVEADTLPLNQQ